jgi:hypothetical protein
MDLDNLSRLTSSFRAAEDVTHQILVESRSKFRKGPAGERTFRFTEDDTAALVLRNVAPSRKLLDPCVLSDLCHSYSRTSAETFLNKRYDVVPAEPPVPAPARTDFIAVARTRQTRRAEIIEALGLAGYTLLEEIPPGFIPLARLCSYRWATRPYERDRRDEYYRPRVGSLDSTWVPYSFGLKACIFVLLKLSDIINALQGRGVYMGNLGPSDVYIKLEPLTSMAPGPWKPELGEWRDAMPIAPNKYMSVDVRLVNYDTWAVKRPDIGYVLDFDGLDRERIHPNVAKEVLAGSVVHWIRHDWVSFSVLAINTLAKCDPFSEGVVKKSSARPVSRQERMALDLPFWKEDEVDTNPFYLAGLRRLSPGLQEELVAGARAQGGLTFDQEQLRICLSELIRCSKCHLQQHISHSRCQNSFCNADL